MQKLVLKREHNAMFHSGCTSGKTRAKLLGRSDFAGRKSREETTRLGHGLHAVVG